MSNTNVFATIQTNGFLFWSQLLPRPLEGGGFLLWYTDNETTDLIEFNKIISIKSYSSSVNSEKQIIILVEFNNEYFCHRFGSFLNNDAENFLTWLKERILF